MNDENMRQAQAWPEYNFWRMLKPGYDYFEKKSPIANHHR